MKSPLKKFRKFHRYKLRYWIWRVKNPFRPYSDYYVDVVLDKIASGRGHPAIGSDVVNGSSSTELLDFLLAKGLQPNHVVVDYGCGSLRLGQSLIGFLAPKNYWGLDVRSEFLELASAKLPPSLKEKAPNLGVIEPHNLALARNAKPDFIAAWHVLSKVPEKELSDFFGKIASMMGEHTRAYIHFPETKTRQKMSGMAWASPRDLILKAVQKAAPGMTAKISLLKPGGNPSVQISVLEFYSAPSAAE